MDKCWYIALSENPERRKNEIETKVKPLVEYLKSIEKNGERNVDDELQLIILKIDELIAKIDDSTVKGDTEEVSTSMDPQDIKQRLQNFKEELLASFKDEGWKEKMLPIIKASAGTVQAVRNSAIVSTRASRR